MTWTTTTYPLLLKDTWQSILLYSDAPDVLSLVQVNRSIYTLLNHDVALWQALLSRELKIALEPTMTTPVSSNRTETDTNAGINPAAAATIRKAFLRASYQRLLPEVHWQALEPLPLTGFAAVTCVLGSPEPVAEQVLVMTSGFGRWNDPVFIKPLSHRQSLASITTQHN